MKTPAEILASATLFCDLLSAARTHRFPGFWEGSAFRSHPCGVIVDGIKFTNDWHRDNYSSIQITDGTGWSKDYSQDSFSNGNPHPQPVGGAAVCVWSSGKWVSEEFRAALEPKALAIIASIQAHVADAAQRASDARAAAAAEQAANRRRVEAAALANALGQASA